MKLPHIDKQPQTDVRTLFEISEIADIFAKTRQSFKVPGFQIFQLHHGENKLIFNQVMMRYSVYQTNMLSWILFSSLKQQPVDRHTHYPDSQSTSLSPLCCVLCGETTNVNVIVFGLTRSTALGASMLTITSWTWLQHNKRMLISIG